MEITVGHTPDADDAFMFYALVTGKIDTEFTIKHVVEDIESLNKRALNHELDITAISAHAYAYIKDYTILRSGGSFGLKYGPIIIAKRNMSLDDLKRAKIAIPGRMTTAYLLLELALGRTDTIEIKFSNIMDAVRNNDVDAGLVIHEAQMTYENAGLQKVLDLGLWWHEISGSLPLPLGINVASRKRLGNSIIKHFDESLKRSITFSLEHFDDALEYAMQYARGTPKEVISRFVRMYVNDVTIDMGEAGTKGLEKLYLLAEEKNIVSNVKPIFP